MHNVSAKLPGVQINQTAELKAVIVGLQHTQGNLAIMSDSRYAVN